MFSPELIRIKTIGSLCVIFSVARLKGYKSYIENQCPVQTFDKQYLQVWNFNFTNNILNVIIFYLSHKMPLEFKKIMHINMY